MKYINWLLVLGFLALAALCYLRDVQVDELTAHIEYLNGEADKAPRVMLKRDKSDIWIWADGSVYRFVNACGFKKA